jgi:hypothetical protein
VSLPGADELFRTTGGRALQPSSPRQHTNDETGGVPAADGRPLRAVPGGAAAEAPAVDPQEATDGAAGYGQEAEHSGRSAEPSAPAASRPLPEQARRPQSAPVPPAAAAQAQQPQPRRKSSRANRRPTGRERHDEKITVYVSAEELMDLEHARLVLRGEHGLAIDRGRIVREAVAVVLADLEARGDASILVRRLRGR